MGLSMTFRSLALSSLCFCILATGAPEKPKGPTVFVSTAKHESLYDILTYPARVMPLINATILAESDGIVADIPAKLGTPVTRNKKILTLKNTDPVFSYAPISITSPVSGVVSSVEVTQGSRVAKGQKLATITDPSRVNVQIEIAISDRTAIQSNLEGEMKIASFERPVPVKVTGVSPLVDPATGTATAELTVINPEKYPVLAPGTVGRVSFRAREHSGIQVPEDAIVYRGRETFLRTIHEGKAKLAKVELGPIRRGSVEVLKGIDPGAQVIVRASSYVADGETVDVQTAPTATF